MKLSSTAVAKRKCPKIGCSFREVIVEVVLEVESMDQRLITPFERGESVCRLDLMVIFTYGSLAHMEDWP